MDSVVSSDNQQDKGVVNRTLLPKSPFLLFIVGGVLLWTFLLSLMYSYVSDNHQAEAKQQLKSVTDHKQQTVSKWLDQHHSDISFISQNGGFLQLIGAIQSRDISQTDILKRLEQVKSAFGYDKISILDAGAQLITETSSQLPASHVSSPVKLVEQSGNSAISYAVNLEKNRFHIDFTARLFKDSDNASKLQGLVVFHVDAKPYFSHLIEGWPNHRATFSNRLGLMTADGVVFVTQSDADEASVDDKLATELDIELHNRLQSGATSGFIEAVDLRQQSVFSYFKVVPNTDWLLISQVDKQEINQPIYSLLFILAVVGLIAIVSLGRVLLSFLKREKRHNQTRLLQANKDYFKGLFMDAPIAYQSLDSKCRLLAVNEAWLELFEYQQSDRDSVLGKRFDSMLTAESKSSFAKAFGDLMDNGLVQNHLFRAVTKAGQERALSVTGRVIKAEDGSVKTYCAIVDVTEALEQEKALKLAAKVFENTAEGVMVTDKQSRIVSVNQAFSDILGFDEKDVLGKTPRVLRSGKHDQAFYKQMWHEIESNGIWKGEIWNRHKSGALIPEWLTITKLINESGEVESYVGVFADISQLKSSEAELTYMANHDALTGLPNRRSLMTSVDYALLQSARSGKCFAVMVLDLDRFKEVNDSYGHEVGDEVLLHISHVLKANLTETDVVARFGGNEFAILISNIEQDDDAGVLATELIAQVSKPFNLSSGTQLSIGCSIGISLYPEHSDNANDLVQQADSALCLSKERGRGHFEYFTSEMTEKAQNRIQTEIELKEAINQNQLELYFQPQVDLSSGAIKGAESLIRWNHPQRGLVGPMDFIPIAEESMLIADIGDWVLMETCRQAKQWVESTGREMVFAVNVSAKQLVYRDLLKSVMNALKQTQLPPEMLELELTESALMHMGDDMQQMLAQLRGLGVRIAIDDFGTGYSSLAYLRSLPLDVLKIDKQFVDDIPNNPQGMQIVNTIIAMAHNLRLDVLAEGVETENQRDFLALKGCDYYQGYLMSKPIKAKEFEKLISAE